MRYNAKNIGLWHSWQVLVVLLYRCMLLNSTSISKEKAFWTASLKLRKAELNELLTVLSAEDSKTLPLQIDHNTIIEQLQLTANKTTLKGMITTPDFSQFEKDLGRKEVLKVIRNNLLNNCQIFLNIAIRSSILIKSNLVSAPKHTLIMLTSPRKTVM